ncbi:hypothetical protein [Candidatus Leptofilum sp.]|uniref:hypothetical protein n=1 Tax=Candidatus Leptofilum sp. TaxID=3241576 RepID=UPI003B5BCC65
MTASTMTLNQIRQKGLEVLSRELSPVGMIRFMQQFETGSGDYSVERHEWLDDLTLEDIYQRIKERRLESEEKEADSGQ